MVARTIREAEPYRNFQRDPISLVAAEIRLGRHQQASMAAGFLIYSICVPLQHYTKVLVISID
jgi:hypothetical protein